MANNYMDMTGVLKLDAVTPVITALFGAFKLDPTTPGNGQVSIAAGTEKNIVSWACVCSDLADLAVTLGTGIETLETVGNRVLHALIETGLEVQPIELRQTAPVPTVQARRTAQAEGHRHRPRAL